MNPAPIQIVSRHRFEDMFLQSSHHWVISIREADEIGIPRPDFINPRVNLAFCDLINGPGIATPEDVESVYQFSLEWMKQVLEDPTKANLVVHCFAGVSRSTAMALIPLLLYYSSFRLAGERLFEVNKYAVPNTHVLYLITQKFGLDPGKVFEDLFRASQGGVGGNVRRR